jgi:N-acetylated-alpha-linked acidic dipeptidase
LGDKAAVYINKDGSGRGFLNAGGSHTLEAFINEVARDVRDPQVGGSVFERARARDLVNAAPAEREKIRARRDNPIAALGSGSDYTPFVQHLGIASLNLGFGGESGGGSYHSAYDSFDHYTRFGDPDFQYGVALAQVCGRATMRLADADALPFEFAALAETIGGYVEEVEKLADDMRRETEQTNRLIAEGAFVKAADPTQAGKAPAIRAPVPHLNFAPLENALERLRRAAKDYQAAAERRSGAESSMGVEVRSALDAMLYKTERALTREEGLPVRPWFKHYIYAPGFYTGYGVKTLPAVREAIEQREWSAIDANVQKTAQAICSASVGNGIFGRRG